MSLPDLSGYVGVTDAARRLGCSAENIQRLRRLGALPAVETPVGRLYAVADLDRVAAERAARQRGRGDACPA